MPEEQEDGIDSGREFSPLKSLGVDILHFWDCFFLLTSIVTEGTFGGITPPLLSFLDGNKYWIRRCPASSMKSRHHCFEGGLVYHSLEVFALCCIQMQALFPGEYTHELRSKILLASILHDIHKALDPFGSPFYVENVLSSGRISERKPWKINPSYLANIRFASSEKGRMGMAYIIEEMSKGVPGGIISMAVIAEIAPSLFAKLEPDVVQAITYHDGGYGPAKHDIAGTESKLAISIHAADMLSSRFQGELVDVFPVESLLERLPPVI